MYFPPYLEVLRANEPPEVVWSGVSGQISKLDAAVNQRDKKMRAEMTELAAKVSNAEDKVDKVRESLEGKMDALSQAREEMDQKLLAELGELKALLAGKEQDDKEP